MITLTGFKSFDIRVGTIISCEDFTKARNKSYKLQIDFGSLGIKKSSAQITALYTKEELIGRQIISIVNFPSKQVADYVSECLILGVYINDSDVVLLSADKKMNNGDRIG